MLEDYDEGGTSADVDKQYFDSYCDPTVHQLMLSDVHRNNFYRQALNTAVGGWRRDESTAEGHTNTCVVFDVGAGTGLLSMMASEAGASAVYAIEASDLGGTLLPAIITENGIQLQKRGLCVPVVLNSTAETIDIASVLSSACTGSGVVRIVVVSEWMGFYLFHENMLSSVATFASKLFAALGITTGMSRGPLQNVDPSSSSAAAPVLASAAVEVVLVPDFCRLMMAPVDLTNFLSAKFAFWERVEGYSMTAMKKYAAQLYLGAAHSPAAHHNPIRMAGNTLVDLIPASALVASGSEVFWASFRTVEEVLKLQARLQCPVEGHGSVFNIPSGVALTGFVLWFDVGYDPAPISASPSASAVVLTTTPPSTVDGNVSTFFAGMPSSSAASSSPPIGATHWKQSLIMLPQVVELSEDTEMGVRLTVMFVGDHVLESASDDEGCVAAGAERCYDVSIELFDPSESTE